MTPGLNSTRKDPEMRALPLFAALFVGSHAFAPSAVGRAQVVVRATGGQELSPARERFNRGKKRVLTRGPKNAKRREYFAQRRAETTGDEYLSLKERRAAAGTELFKRRAPKEPESATEGDVKEPEEAPQGEADA